MAKIHIRSRNVFFTSDTHFSHKLMIERKLRPFLSLEDMDETLIQRWNAKVSPGDIIIHAGDFALCPAPKAKLIFESLHGEKHLVLGNHDHSDTYKKLPWKSVSDVLWVEGVHEMAILVSHYGHRVWNKSHHGSLHLYGHSHGSLPGNNQSLDIGSDVWDFTPVSYEEIRARMATLPNFKQQDHHDPNYFTRPAA